MSKEGGETVGLEWAMRKKEGTKGGASPLYLGQSHHSDLFLAPARFEGLPVGKWEGKKK